MSFNFGGSSGSQSQSGQTAPWVQQQPYLQQGFQTALQNLQSNSPEYYPGSTIAPMSGYTSQGLQDIANQTPTSANAANSFLSGLASVSNSALPDPFSSQYYNPNANSYAGVATNPNANSYAGTAINPYLNSGANTYLSPLVKSISDQVMPAVTGSYALAGRTGSSPIAQQAIAKGITDTLAPYEFNAAQQQAQQLFQGGESQASRLQSANEQRTAALFQVGESQAAREQAANAALAGQQFTAGQNALTMGMDAYNNAVNRKLQAASEAPSVINASYVPASQMLTAGQIDQNQAQQQLADAVARWNFGQNIDAQKLAQYMTAINGNYGSIFSTTGANSGSSYGVGGGK